jgi:hypothetical protein
MQRHAGLGSWFVLSHWILLPLSTQRAANTEGAPVGPIRASTLRINEMGNERNFFGKFLHGGAQEIGEENCIR